MDARRVCADMHPLTPQVRVIASPQSWVEGEAVRQLEAAARLPGMRAAVGLPDLHPGKGAPVGAAFASEAVFYPFLVGSDIGCGMGLWDVELPARKAKPERWAARLDLEGAWQGDTESFLAEQGVAPCGHEASLGTVKATVQAPSTRGPLASRSAPSPMMESTRGPVRPPEDMASYLRSRYGKNIRDPHTQMRMLEELMRHFQKLNPSGWEADVLALLKQAFPELYDELALRLRQRVDYERWVKDHPELREKPAAERRAALWEERNRLFGKDVAEKIWAAELRNVAVADSLAAIDALVGLESVVRVVKVVGYVASVPEFGSPALKGSTGA